MVCKIGTVSILKKYEFDGIIFAFLSSDWQRPFTIFHTDQNDKLLIGGFGNSPKDSVDFQTNYLKKMTHRKKWKVISDAEINELINEKPSYTLQQPTLNIIELFYYKVILNLKKTISQKDSAVESVKNSQVDPFNQLISQQGKRKVKLIQEIITDCKEKQKDIILCSIPFKSEIIDTQKDIPIKNNNSLKILSKIYDINYFNGYNIFRQKSTETLDSYYYKEDMHWNDNGSNYFAITFAKHLLEINSKKDTARITP